MRLVLAHRWLLAALAVGAALRVAMMAAFFPAFVVSDAPVYLSFVRHPQLSANRPAGYDSFLWLLHQVSPSLALVAGVQHLLGLAIAVLVYVVLRRWGVGDLPAALATLPVLLDGMQLMLEHTPLSDVLFEAVLVAGIAVVAWDRRPSLLRTGVAAAVLGGACLVRVAGEPMLVVVLGYCLLTAPTWRRRATTALLATACFAAPVVGYAALYHHQHGAWGTAQAGGRSLYMRTTGFVDCSRLTGLPTYEQILCPAAPVGHRLDPTVYGWLSPDHTAGMTPPHGVSLDAAFRDFAERAIRAQLVNYARIVARDTALTFSWRRDNAYEYDTAGKWELATFATGHVTARARATYATYGGTQLHVRQPLARWLGEYGRHVYLRGTLALALALVAVVGAWWRRDRRPLVLLGVATGVELVLVPVVTLEVIWRYVLPAVPLLPMAAVAALAPQPRAPSHSKECSGRPVVP